MASPTVSSPSSAPDNGASDVAAAAVAAATRTSLGLSASTQNTQKRAGDLWNYFAVHTGAPKYLDINERNMAGELLNYRRLKQPCANGTLHAANRCYSLLSLRSQSEESKISFTSTIAFTPRWRPPLYQDFPPLLQSL